jgi:secreted PhoX family phosphatase
VCEHDPYDPEVRPRKHTALGRFRHENTAFRARRGSRIVFYMGDDKTNEGVYKFVSDRAYRAGNRRNNLKILESGTLYIAKWSPEGRRRFATSGDTVPLTATSGTGEWVEVLESELVDTATLLRARFGNAEYDLHYATNRPEDVEVEPDTGHVFVAFTNNSSVRDVHGAVRRIIEDGNDPEAMTFTWEEFANGGPTGRAAPGEEGFSCPDNLVFDKAGDVWVVTDISSTTLNRPGPLQYHANNALFYIPTSGPNAGVAFRFGNMPVESEGTGPYFTPDEQTLFLNVQHPGEGTSDPSSTIAYGDEANYTSYWPRGDKTAARNPALPRPATVAITRPPRRRYREGSNLIPRPPRD